MSVNPVKRAHDASKRQRGSALTMALLIGTVVSAIGGGLMTEGRSRARAAVAMKASFEQGLLDQELLERALMPTTLEVTARRRAALGNPDLLNCLFDTGVADCVQQSMDVPFANYSGGGFFTGLPGTNTPTFRQLTQVGRPCGAANARRDCPFVPVINVALTCPGGVSPCPIAEGLNANLRWVLRSDYNPDAAADGPVPLALRRTNGFSVSPFLMNGTIVTAKKCVYPQVVSDILSDGTLVCVDPPFVPTPSLQGCPPRPASLSMVGGGVTYEDHLKFHNATNGHSGMSAAGKSFENPSRPFFYMDLPKSYSGPTGFSCQREIVAQACPRGLTMSGMRADGIPICKNSCSRSWENNSGGEIDLVRMPRFVDKCRWGTDGNLSAENGDIRARHGDDLDLGRTGPSRFLKDSPDYGGEDICSIEEISVEQNVRFDDHFFLLLGNKVLVTEYPDAAKLLERTDEPGVLFTDYLDGSRRRKRPLEWKWAGGVRNGNNYAGDEVRNSSELCFPGADECVLPKNETSGKFRLNFRDPAAMKYLAKLVRNGKKFRTVVTGDNDSPARSGPGIDDSSGKTDCSMHQDLVIRAKYKSLIYHIPPENR